MNKLILTLLAVGFIATACYATSERIYIDEKEMDLTQDAFYLHIGNNEWIKTETVHRDKTGLYTFESDISNDNTITEAAYVKTWKCPYCFTQVEEGKACPNEKCNSKNK